MQPVYQAITPGSTVYSPPLQWLWVGSTGNIAIQGVTDASPVTILNVPVGPLALPYPVGMIPTSGTTAGSMIGAAFPAG